MGTSTLRDVAILFVLVFLGVVWLFFSAVTRRGRRLKASHDDRVQVKIAAQADPLPGLADYAASQGWQGPSTNLATNSTTADFVHQTTRSLWGFAKGFGYNVQATRYTNVYTGRVDGNQVAIGNSWTTMQLHTRNTGSHENPASVAILGLGVVLPPLWVNLQSFPRRLPNSMDATLANDAFTRTFRVQATDAEYATSMMSMPMMQLLMTRDDWAFAITGATVVCVCKQPFRTVDDVRTRVAQLQRFVELIPSSVRQQKAVAMPTLPDGTTFDPDDPVSLQRFNAMLAAMTPEQREQFRREFRRER